MCKMCNCVMPQTISKIMTPQDRWLESLGLSGSESTSSNYSGQDRKTLWLCSDRPEQMQETNAEGKRFIYNAKATRFFYLLSQKPNNLRPMRQKIGQMTLKNAVDCYRRVRSNPCNMSSCTAACVLWNFRLWYCYQWLTADGLLHPQRNKTSQLPADYSVWTNRVLPTC
jgi:hypothetical protein